MVHHFVARTRQYTFVYAQNLAEVRAFQTNLTRAFAISQLRLVHRRPTHALVCMPNDVVILAWHINVNVEMEKMEMLMNVMLVYIILISV